MKIAPRGLEEGTTENSEGDIPVAITIEVDGHPIHVETADLEQAEAALKLARTFDVLLGLKSTGKRRRVTLICS